MPAIPLQLPARAPAGGSALRMGIESTPESGSPEVRWLLRRNCSATPHQVLVGFASICALGTLVAALFWWQGAALVAPFAGLELLGLGIALLVYARHATDREQIVLHADRLTVERVDGGRVERAEFVPAWVRVEPAQADRRLVELSTGGCCMVVGRHLRPEQRRVFVTELRWALRRPMLPTSDSAGPRSAGLPSEN